MELSLALTLIIVLPIVAGAAGAFFGYRITRKMVKKELKNNPPVNENMIRAMYTQMGRKPSEAQIKAVVNAMKREQNK